MGVNQTETHTSISKVPSTVKEPPKMMGGFGIFNKPKVTSFMDSPQGSKNRGSSGWYWEPTWVWVENIWKKYFIFLSISCTKMHDSFPQKKNHAFKKRKKTLSLCGDVLIGMNSTILGGLSRITWELITKSSYFSLKTTNEHHIYRLVFMVQAVITPT